MDHMDEEIHAIKNRLFLDTMAETTAVRKTKETNCLIQPKKPKFTNVKHRGNTRTLMSIVQRVQS